MTPSIRAVALGALLMMPASSALAQARVEVSLGVWNPAADIVVSSDGAGLAGTSIDLRQDLGLTDGHFPDVSVSFRAAARHKVRFEYVPIAYASSAALPRDVVFSGLTYPRGAPVDSHFEWTSYRFGYEYDFFVRPRWTAGLIVEARQTDIQERLVSGAADQARRTRVPVPAAGGTVSARATGRVSIVGEFIGFAVPTSADRHYGGHYVDLTILGTFDLTTHLGAQAGYRLIDVGHLGESDSATMTMKGVYVGAVFRR